MTKIDIIRGLKGLIGVYKDSKLVATHDKHCTQKELDLCVLQHGGSKAEVHESDSDFDKFSDIPEELSKPTVKQVKKDEG